MAEPRGIVWILGAGFSRPLGAPLLDDLIARSAEADITAAYDKDPHAWPQFKLMKQVMKLRKSGEKKRWSNAEEFIETLDLALTNETVKKLLLKSCQISEPIGGLLAPEAGGEGGRLKAYRDCAHMILAAQICLFLKGADPFLERWAPYRAWISTLDEADTVITFNYDRVIDMVKPFRNGGVFIPVPMDAGKRYDRPTVLKMHGSVDWIKNLEAGVIDPHPDDPEVCLHCGPDRMVLATPGPTKYRMIEKAQDGPGVLKPIWDRAAEAIAEAEAVVFIGYRMPPTDAHTKQWLVDQLRWRVDIKNKINPSNGLPRVIVHTVLGPGINTTNDHSKRLVGLLREVDPCLLVRAWDMGTEDFLGLIPRDRLIREAE